MFSDDFLEFLGALNADGVEWMLVGGYAYQLHVQPRMTKDLDVWINPTRENLERFSRALLGFLGQPLDVDAALAVLETNKLGFAVAGIPPYRVEALLRLKGLEFADASARAITRTVQGVEMRVIHPHDLARTKRLAGRPRDLLDVADLIKIHGEPPDG